MLVLSRKQNEEITIGNHIRIVITKISGNRVTVAIEAPRDIAVMRRELNELEWRIEEAPER